MDNQENGFQLDDQRLEDLIRQSAPVSRPSDQHRETLRMVLKNNVRNHKLRSGLVAAGLVAAGLAGSLFQMTDVGSEGFDLVSAPNPVLEHPVAEAPFSGTRIAHPDMDGSLSQKDLEQLRSVYEQYMAGQVVVTEVSGWTLQGRTVFTISWEVIMDGKRVVYSDMLNPPDRKTGLSFTKFWGNYEEVFHDRIKQGDARIIGRETVDIKGTELLFTKWASSFPEWGEVVYWDGKPPVK